MPNGNDDAQNQSQIDQIEKSFSPRVQTPGGGQGQGQIPVGGQDNQGSIQQIERGLPGQQPPGSAPKPIWSGSILPVSQYPGEPPRLDPHAGLVGGFLSAASIPSDFMAGRLPLNSPEMASRMANAALLATPAGPGIAARAAIPSGPELREIGGNQIESVAKSGVNYVAGHTVDMANNALQTLHAEARYAPNDPTFAALSDFIKRAPNVSPRPITDVMALRSRLSELSRSADVGQASTAKRALGFVDDFVQNPPAGSVVTGDAQRAASDLRTGIANYATGMKSATLTNTEGAAQLAARPTSDALRGYLRTLLDPRYKQRLAPFTPEERQAMADFVAGSKTQSALGTVGKVFSTSHSPLWALAAESIAKEGGANLPEQIAALAGPMAIGKSATWARDKLADRAFRHVDELIRSRSPEYQSRIQAEPQGFAQGPLRPWERNVGLGTLRTLGASSPPSGLGNLSPVSPPPPAIAYPGTSVGQLFD
jgi:hypothetical protein